MNRSSILPQKMFTQIHLTLLLVFTTNLKLLVHSSIIPSPPPFNISHFIFPKVSTFSEPPPPHFLQGVLTAIANVQKWELEDIRVSKLDVKKAKYGSLQRYEFGVKVGKTELVFKLYDQVKEWSKLLSSSENNVSLDFETLVKGLREDAVINSFRIDGPFELRAVGNGGNLSLLLPLNVSHSGLSRISISKGISVEVKNAEEISIIHPPNHQEMPRGILQGVIWPISPALPHILITGPASIEAYRTGPSSYIKTRRSSHDSVQLLPDKCYVTQGYQNPRHLFRSIPFFEKIVSNLLTDRDNRKTGFGSFKLKIKASNAFRFQLEVENKVRSNDAYWSTLPEWRTRPILERVWFEVSARIDGAIMKPLGLKKVRPFIDVDSNALSSLLSNISFSKFTSGLVPPEALTLDVKW